MDLTVSADRVGVVVGQQGPWLVVSYRESGEASANQGEGTTLTIPDSDLVPVAAVIVLAAGGGARMRSRCSKLLHELHGKSMPSYVVSATTVLNPHHPVVVVGHQRVEISEHLESLSRDVIAVIQEQQSGTDHATVCGLRQLPDLEGEVVVTYGCLLYIPPSPRDRLRRYR